MSGSLPDVTWRGPDGEIISCVEKLKVLRENLEEIRQLCQDALDDAVLMGCEQDRFRKVLAGLVSRLESEYQDSEAGR